MGWALKKDCQASERTRKGPRSSMRVRAGREVEKTLNAASSRRPQKSRRRDVKFALRYARDSRAGEGRSVIRLVSSTRLEGRCSTYW